MSATDHTAQRAGLPPLVPVILFGTAGLAWMWRLAATSVGSDGDRWLVVLAGLAGLAAFLASAKRPRRQAVPWLALAIGCTTWGASHPVRFDAPLSLSLIHI